MAAAVMAQDSSESNQEPSQVAEVIFEAATDGTRQVRYVSGDGAKTLLGSRYSLEQDEQFVAGMRAQFGL